MEKIKLQIQGNQIAVAECPPVITAGTVGLRAEFTFDSQWDDLTKTAVFKAGDKVVTATLAENTQTVPWEALEKPNLWLYIGVYGANAAGTVVIPTLWAQAGMIHTGADPEGDPALEPTAPVWQQLLTRVENLSPEAIGATPVSQTEQLDQQVQSLDQLAGEIDWKINDHMNNGDGNNPHGVTAAQAGAAPAGYGLGEKAAFVDNWNAGFVNAFARSNTNSPDGKMWYGLVCRDGTNTATTTEVAFSTDAGNAVSEVRRSRNAAGTWGQWEYVNPPMLEGVEYRTTERWMGRPVYTKLFNCAMGDNCAFLEIPDYIIRMNGCIMNEEGFPVYPLPHGQNAWLEAESGIGIELVVNNPGMLNVLDILAVQVWYIK